MAIGRVDVETESPSAGGIFRAPVFPGDPTRTRRIRALHSVVLTTGAIVGLIFALGIPFIFTNRFAAAMIGGALALVTLAGSWLTRRGRADAASWTLTVGGWLIVTVVTLIGGGLGSVAPMGYLAVVTTGIWLIGRRGGLIFAVASVLAGFAIAAADANGLRFPRLLPMRPLTSWLYLTFSLSAAALPMVLAIRDLKEALRDVKRSKAITDAIIDHIPGIFCMIDNEGRLLRFNPRLSEITGIPAEKILQTPARMLLAEHDRDAALAALRQCFGEGSTVCELSVLSARDSVAPHLFHGTKLTIDGMQRAVVIGLDLRERRRAEQALRRFEERYRDFMERAPFAVVATDPQARLEFANDCFERLSGWSRVELLDKPFLRFVDDADRPAALDSLGDVLAGRENLAVIKTRLLAKDGRPRILQWNISPILTREGLVRGAICLGVDLTERHLLEAQLLQAQKLESLGRLAAGVAHDFNNILTVIGGFAELLHSSGESPEERRHSAGEIISASTRAASLTRQLLAFSRKQVLAPQVLDLNSLVRESVHLLDRLIGAGIRIQTNLSPGALTILADQGQLHQVIMNLAVNSRDAMPDGGVLTLSTAARGNFHELVVADNGHGMDEATRARAFEPFFTTKEPGQGSGLGLAMVYGIVEQSLGTVHLESVLGSGTVVTIRLPATTAEAPVEAQPANPPARRPVRILLAEDESQVRELVAVILREAGHSVIPAADGPSALEEAERVDFQLEAAIVDVAMPYMTGPELVHRLRSRLPGLPVVFISGYSHTPPVEIQKMSPQTEYVEKPFQSEQLLSAVDRVLHV